MFVFNSVLQGNTVDIKTGLPNPPHFSGISVSHSCLPPSYIFRLQGLSTISIEYNSMFLSQKLPAFSPFIGFWRPNKKLYLGLLKEREARGATGWRCATDLPGQKHRSGCIMRQRDRKKLGAMMGEREEKGWIVSKWGELAAMRWT